METHSSAWGMRFLLLIQHRLVLHQIFLGMFFLN